MRTYTRVRDLLATKPQGVYAVPQSVSAAECARVMSERGVGSLVVTRGRDLLGIVTWHDILQAVAEHTDTLDELAVTEMMTKIVHVVTEDVELEELEALMRAQGIRHVPVVRGAEVIGMVTAIDVLGLHLARADAFNQDLQDYVFGVAR